MTRTVDRVLSVSVRVTDQDRALAWYRDVLGCEVVRDVELGPGTRWLEVAPPGSPVTVALLTEEAGIPIGVRYAAADVRASSAALTAAGAEAGEVLDTGFAPPMLTSHDPDGNVLVLVEGA
jgi:catechol 2,3-dioxygenase-like lactoylglutathione lyase family enzyme